MEYFPLTPTLGMAKPVNDITIKKATPKRERIIYELARKSNSEEDGKRPRKNRTRRYISKYYYH